MTGSPTYEYVCHYAGIATSGILSNGPDGPIATFRKVAHRIRKRQFSLGRGRYRTLGSLKQIWERALASILQVCGPQVKRFGPESFRRPNFVPSNAPVPWRLQGWELTFLWSSRSWRLQQPRNGSAVRDNDVNHRLCSSYLRNRS